MDDLDDYPDLGIILTLSGYGIKTDDPKISTQLTIRNAHWILQELKNLNPHYRKILADIRNSANLKKISEEEINQIIKNSEQVKTSLINEIKKEGWKGKEYSTDEDLKKLKILIIDFKYFKNSRSKIIQNILKKYPHSIFKNIDEFQTISDIVDEINSIKSKTSVFEEIINNSGKKQKGNKQVQYNEKHTKSKAITEYRHMQKIKKKIECNLNNKIEFIPENQLDYVSNLFDELKKRVIFKDIHTIDEAKLSIINHELKRYNMTEQTSLIEAEKFLDCLQTRKKIALNRKINIENVTTNCEDAYDELEKIEFHPINGEKEQERIDYKLERASENLTKNNP